MTTTSTPTRSERPSPEQRALLEKKESIELSKRRVLSDLETSKSPIYRRNLEAGLEFLEQRIAEVDRALLDLQPRGNKKPPAIPIRGRR